jgi:hypothetical protein
MSYAYEVMAGEKVVNYSFTPEMIEKVSKEMMDALEDRILRRLSLSSHHDFIPAGTKETHQAWPPGKQATTEDKPGSWCPKVDPETVKKARRAARKDQGGTIDDILCDLKREDLPRHSSIRTW